LSSVTDLTAIWNANAFFAYIFSVKLLGLEWGTLRLFAVSMATLGVVTVVYGGSIGPSSDPEPFKENLTNASTPFIGDMLTLVASLGYGLYQVLYTKYIALSYDPRLTSESAHYHQLSTSTDNIVDEEPSACAAVTDSMVYPPPFGLHPNLITTSIGLCTLLVFWIPIPILHYYQIEEFRLPPNAATAIAIAGIATSGVVFSAGYMVRSSSVPIEAGLLIIVLSGRFCWEFGVR
jgi:drug/metabolite transporter (DMT)-like permease